MSNIALPQSVVMLNKVNNRDYATETFVFQGDKAKRDSLIVVALTVTGGCNLTSTSDGS